MTTMNEVTVTCCICGTEGIHLSVGSTNALGYPDLDTRPPEMERSTVYYTIQRCLSCGYCSADLSTSVDNLGLLVKSKKYQDILFNSEVPDAAASFLASSYISELSREYSEAAWLTIQASWICDDENDAPAAKNCRERAIEMIEIGEALSQYLSEQAGASEAITIDIMRRAGHFQDATKLAAQTKAGDIEEMIKKIISYEIGLIHNQDIKAHTIDEVMRKQGPSW